MYSPTWGDVYWFDFHYPTSGQRTFAGVHPALVIGVARRILPGTTQIIPLTGAEHRRTGYEYHVLVSKAECPFLDKDSIVKVDQIYCVETRDMPDQYRMGTLSVAVMRRVYAKLVQAIGLDRFRSP